MLESNSRKFGYSNTKIFKDVNENNPANLYLFEVNNRYIRKSCETYSKLTIKITDIDVVLVFLLLTMKIFHTFF